MEYLATREDINFRIMTIVQESGAGFAFPSQTVYLADDDSAAPARAVETPDGMSGPPMPHALVKALGKPAPCGTSAAENRSTADRLG